MRGMEDGDNVTVAPLLRSARRTHPVIATSNKAASKIKNLTRVI
jgi:hypothetical protein